MYSARCRKLFFIIAFFIFIPIIVNLIIPEMSAAWVVEDNATSIYPARPAAWAIADNATSIYPARPGYIPVLDGVEEAAWSTTAKYTESAMALDFRLKYNGTTAYCIIKVKKATHSFNESVLLLLSNNGSTLTGAEYFKDAKFVSINNVTEDRHLVAGSYSVDNDQNITGMVRFENPTTQNWSVYEFGFRYKNTDPTLDTTWSLGNSYLAKIRVGDANTQEYVDSPAFSIEMGVATNATEPGLFDFLLDINVITWVLFTVSAGIYGVLGVYVLVSKKRLLSVTGFSPGMLQKKNKGSEREFDETTEQSGEEVLGEEDQDEGEQEDGELDDKELDDSGEED